MLAIRTAALEIVAATAATVAAVCIGITSAFLAEVAWMIIVPILFPASVGRLTRCFIDVSRQVSAPIAVIEAPRI